MFVLPKLDYSYDALEPHIDALTMEIHHSRHHQAYVDGLNSAIKNFPELQNKPLKELLINLKQLPANAINGIRNHGGGHFNHSFFWKVLKSPNNNQPTPYIQELINRDFGSFENFKTQFEEAAKSRFGSGWAWLVMDNNKKLIVTSTANQDCPISDGYKPILALDVWEHAYYLKYQNKRIDYIREFFNVIDWMNVEKFAKDEITLECDQ